MKGLYARLLLLAALAPSISTAQTVPAACAPMVKAIGVPLTVEGDRVILCRLGYVLEHDNNYRTPSWVIEHLTPARFNGSANRGTLGNPFAADPDLASAGTAQAELADYRAKLKGRAFDRGHMAPAADMKFDGNAMRESFYLSNMAPQQGLGLNRQIWAELEGIVRNWTCTRGELYVISGPIYDTLPPDLLGPNQVAVPTAFYKIAYDPAERRAISFILPNEKIDKKGRRAWDALQDYIVPLRTVEERASLTLFTGLTARDRRRLASLRSVMWSDDPVCKTKSP